MHFAPDALENLEFAVLLGNTHALASKSGGDELTTIDEMYALATNSPYPFTGRIDRNDKELAAVRRVRSRVRTIWTLNRDEAASEINSLLAEANVHPFLTRHDDLDWHLHTNDPQAPLAERMQGEIGFALFDVVRSNNMWRLRQCAAPNCEGLLADLSRNGSRRFCSIRCGNRMNQIAYRERQSAHRERQAAQS